MKMKADSSKMRNKLITVVALCILGAAPLLAQTAADPLKAGFQNPPASARPRVWWHWMNGNISKEGIRLDLEWMHRVGLGGFQNFDAALSTPQVVPQRLVYMTPEWKDAFKYAITTADKLGLEAAIAGSPGWSETGGPWVPPSEAMKKYTWSETTIEGGRPFTGTLAHPPANTGPFQDIPGGENPAQFYAESAVVAYRVPASDVSIESLHPKITASGGSGNNSIDAAMLFDGKLDKSTSMPGVEGEDKQAWVQYEFASPQTIRSMTIVRGGQDSGEALEASDDGRTYRLITAIPKNGSREHTLSFAPVTAKYFRFTFKGTKPDASGKKPVITLAELAVHPGARVQRFEEKAAFNTMSDLYQFESPAIDPADAIRKDDVIDLTGKMQPDGTLSWTPPPGKWVVLRTGYSLLGINNHPATKEATGLEVDKLNSKYVANYMNGYLDSYQQTVGKDLIGKRGVQYVITDSWEAGAQNWTDDMVAQFTKRRGYDPRPWVPVLTGRVVESAQASDQFLWDLRKTIADLTADEHYGQVQASLKARGMGHYGESHEAGRAFIADGMEVKKLDDIPMGAMWTQRPGVNRTTWGFNTDDRESASVAHIYGQNLAAAESMTAGEAAWAWSPATLKPTADQEFLNGINRFVIHESAHQPLINKAPGMTLGPYGQWFNRNETWAEDAGPWVKYLSRTSFMLQQGHFDADILYFYGEDSNLTAIFNNSAPDVPAGYNFDYINADGLIHAIHSSAGKLTTASGMQYRLLALDAYSKHMSLPVLRAIAALVREGASVAGQKPADTPSLADDAAEFQRLNDELFGNGTGIRSVGKGKVYAGLNADGALKAMDVAPDFDHSKPEADTTILFAHRKLKDGDIYFLDNRSDREETVDASFRLDGKVPELWYAETGTTKPTSYKIAEGRTSVPLHFEPWGTVFVVFRKAATQPSHTLPAAAMKQVAAVDGPWTLQFEAGRGAPASITIPTLTAWNESSDAGVKYFSGAGTYTKTIQAPASWFHSGATLWLDLGDVKNLADVTVNGKSLGQVWHAPYRVNLTGALKPGANQITIKVINAWVNRLIGDEQPNATKYTFADVKPYKADSPLQASGLLGPVVILQTSTP